MAAKTSSNPETPKTKTKAKVQTLPKGMRVDKDGCYAWEFKRKRGDGSTFRKVGKSKELDKALTSFDNAKAEYERGEESRGQVPSLGEWADYYVQNILPHAPSRTGHPCSPRTIDSYVHLLTRWHKAHLGDVQLDKLTPERVEELLAKVGGEVQSRLNVRNLGSKLYVEAQRRGKVPQGFNPFKIVQVARPRQKRAANGAPVSDKRILTDEEEQRLFDQALGSKGFVWAYGAFLLAARCGLRISEVAGLDWRNVDLERGVLVVDQQSVNVTKKTRDLVGIKSENSKVVTDPKTDSGNRVIPIPPSVRQWLTAHREETKDLPWVFPNGHFTGRIDRDRLNTAMNKTVARCKFRTHDEQGTPLAKPTFHDLRHTFCTRMANRYKVSPNVLKTLAGHANIVTTLGYYVHSEEANLFEAMANIP